MRPSAEQQSGQGSGQAKGSLWVLVTLLALCWETPIASAVVPGVGGPKTTLVVFSDRPMPESTWGVLFAELRREAAAEARSILSLDAAPQVVRGIDVVPGQLMENPIVVKLHGDCRPPVGVTVFPSDAPLGWVRREEGRISPFVQVDCTRVAQVLSARLIPMDGPAKSSAMCEAIARVILHEWVHIAEQTDRHTRKGVTKRSFGSTDLVPDVDLVIARTEHAPGLRESKSR